MIGVVAYGGYIPRLRLDRMTIYRSVGWFTPAILAVAQGERSVCNWDEDALSMAVEASRDGLVGLDRESIDSVYLCSTTLPYADRLNAGILATALSLPESIYAADVTGSQRAGTTGLIAALDAVKAGSKQRALVAASDHRQTQGAYFYEMWFGDGAASLVVGSGDEVVAELLGSTSLSVDMPHHYRGAGKDIDYTWEERWVRDEGYSKHIPRVIAGLLDKTGLQIGDVAHLAYPCFFGREHAGIAKQLGASKEQVLGNLHAECGETGVAHPIVLLSQALERAEPGDVIVVASFGQGGDALAFRVTEAIRDLPARRGITGSLQAKQMLDSYERFARFRGKLDLAQGIRGEIGGQTAMTTLYRNREMILGLVGGKCEACGTPQFPKGAYCVNPECGASDEKGQMVDYSFADQSGRVMMYTGDHLTVTVDPPAIYGMVQFDDGGRILLDFTDCTLDDVRVGLPVKMSFRRRWVDDDRGYTGYFWKAVPARA